MHPAVRPRPAGRRMVESLPAGRGRTT